MRREDQLGGGTIDSGGRSVITVRGCTAFSCLCGLYWIAYMPAWSAGLAWQDGFSSFWSVTHIVFELKDLWIDNREENVNNARL